MVVRVEQGEGGRDPYVMLSPQSLGISRVHGMSGISKISFTCLSRELDNKVNSFLNRPLESDGPGLWLDATYQKVREAGRIVSMAVTIATGVNPVGAILLKQKTNGRSSAGAP